MKHWNAFLGWKGWRIIFGMPFWLLLAVSVLCAGGLVWVFARGLEQTVPSYFLYGASAYCLTALCLRLPRALRREKDWLSRYPKLDAALKNRERAFRTKLLMNQLLNFGYGIGKIAAGVLMGSAWVGADGIYNLAQALVQLFQIIRRKKPGTMERQWRSYRLCGWLILLLHLTLIGIVFQMVNWNRVEAQGEIMVIATAAFAFYKFITSFYEIARDRKHEHPIDSSVRMLELSQAIFAIFSLQAGLLHTFGTGEGWENYLNHATGSAACLLTAAIGVYMIRRGTRQLRQLQEDRHGA